MNIFALRHALAIVAILTSSLLFSQEKQSLTNEIIWGSPAFYAASVNGVLSMNDGIHYSSLDRSDKKTEVNKYAYKDSQKIATLVPASALPGDKVIGDYQFSADETKVLIQTDVEGVYRYSNTANFYVYDLKSGKSTPLTDFKLGKQRLADFSPSGNQIAFVRDNNLFVKDLNKNSEVQVTTDGENNKIINGFPDWVNEEEFGYAKAFHWSPKGTKIAFCRFDESAVKEFQMAMYGDLYPEQYTFKYPKAGEVNSTVQVKVYDLSTGKTKDCNFNTREEFYVPRIKWTADDNKLCIMKMNRHQNHLQFLMADLSKDNPFGIELTSIYDEKADTYIDINDNLVFLKDGRHFLWNSQKSGYNHLYLFDMNGNQASAITSGNWEVVEFKGIDEATKTVFYTSAEVSPMEKHVYAVSTDGKKKRKLSIKPGQNDAVFSNTFKYYINYHSDANTPPYITLHNASGKLIKELETNERLRNELTKYTLSTKTFFNFKTERGDVLNGWMIKPANFDESKKYPVLMDIYGGPGSNTVLDRWGGHTHLWHQMMAQHGYVIVSVDPRGTMFRGRDFMHSTYLQLGKLETEDMISSAKHLASLNFVDKDRIGIQGWSYGGYMSSLCMTKGADFFKAGVAIAPVTNWRFYDSIYTERFMQTPQENASGYDDNSPINHVKLLKGKYLLVHGAADDNVHYQNTMEMINALVAANKQFEHFIYPNRNHGIYGGTTRLHLFNMITDFHKRSL
jgi:dipeptidyl-peptidase 4